MKHMKENQLINNAKWIIACKVVQSLIQLVVGMLSARYLGPSNYGLISYASSVVAFVIPVMQLGLQFTLVQEYVDNPEKEGQIAGTALVMNLLSAVACMIGVTSFAMIVNRGETDTIIVCALYSTSLFFQGVEMLQYWFQAKLLSKYSSLAMLCSYLVVSVYKIFLLVTQKNVYWFALSHAVEYGVTGLLLVVAYYRNGAQKLRFSGKIAREMIGKSAYYISAALMVVLYSNTANIMLKLISGETENGYYAAAVTASVVVQFVYLAIIDSARPVILESKKTDQKQYEKNMARLYCVILYLTLAQCIVFTVFAKLIIQILYGADYLAAVPVLQIFMWQHIFSFMGWIRNIWILAEEKHSLLPVINLCGVVVNVALNLCLIPRWGACGAAVASVLTQVVTNFVVGFIMKDIRPNNRLMLAGLNPKFAWKTLREFVEKR